MPDKNLNQVPRAIREQYQKGVTALQRQNFDYAIAILTQVLEHEPGFFDCRQALRATQFKKSGSGGGGFFKKMFSGASTSPLIAKGQLALHTQPQEALGIAEQILTSDPNSSAGHRLLAEAARLLDFPKAALLSLEILAKNNPKDEEIQRQMAQVYVDLAQPEKAEQIYIELTQLHPDDPKLQEELKNLSARKTMAEGGYEALEGGGGSYRDILKDKEEAVSLEQQSRQVKTEDVAQRLIGEYEARLKTEPGNLKLMRSLAELYAQKNDYDRSLECYNKIIAAGANDSAVQKAIADTTLRKLDYAISQLDPQAPDYPEKCAQIKAEREAYTLEECKRRVDAYPNDLQIRFEMGVLYFNAGKISEAIQELQKAQAHPHRRIQAMGYLGQCFARRNMNDMAARKLQDALKEKLVMDDEKKELLYALGCVLEKMSKKDEAIEQFKQIYEVDIGFKDVNAKVDAYYNSQG